MVASLTEGSCGRRATIARSASSRTVSPTNVVISNQTGSSTGPHFTDEPRASRSVTDGAEGRTRHGGEAAWRPALTVRGSVGTRGDPAPSGRAGRSPPVTARAGPPTPPPTGVD